jgi:transcription elongation GreA/GreB family factor
MNQKKKEALLKQLKARLKCEFDTIVAAHRATHEGATHEEAKPENDKDTRALEQSYLARGQALRVATLQEDLRLLDALALRSFNDDSRIALSALVRTLDENDEEHLYFLVPAGAGETLDSAEGTVKIVTPSSPLGRSLLGARVDDEIRVHSPSGVRVLMVAELS